MTATSSFSLLCLSSTYLNSSLHWVCSGIIGPLRKMASLDSRKFLVTLRFISLYPQIYALFWPIQKSFEVMKESIMSSTTFYRTTTCSLVIFWIAMALSLTSYCMALEWVWDVDKIWASRFPNFSPLAATSLSSSKHLASDTLRDSTTCFKLSLTSILPCSVASTLVIASRHHGKTQSQTSCLLLKGNTSHFPLQPGGMPMRPYIKKIGRYTRPSGSWKP